MRVALMPKTVLLVGSDPHSLINFRGALIKDIVALGHTVHVAAPDISSDTKLQHDLVSLGSIPHDLPLQRAGINPLLDLVAMIGMWRLMRAIRPHTLICYTIKPVIWGTLAGWLAAVPQRYALITGLGYAFTGTATGKRRVIQKIACSLYKMALKRAARVFFQNPDDAALFRDLRLIPTATPVEVVNGSGVDTAAFTPAVFPKGPISVLLIARLLGDKGIREYAAAAATVRTHYPETTFHLVGGTDSNPNSLSSAEVESWQNQGHLVWHGSQKDVRPFIAASHIYVLPSYREGTPRTVLEAMAMGRPIVTTDAPGCRETVIEGENGFLVPIRDSKALAAAITKFIDTPELIATMGKASHRLVTERYDVSKVNADIIEKTKLAKK